MQPQATKGTRANDHTSSQEPRRSQRDRKLTEKGQELYNEQIRRFAHRFTVSYEEWNAIAKDAKQALSGQCSNNLLHEHISKISAASENLNIAYDELRRIDNPDHDTRRRIDTCDAVTRKIIQTAKYRLETADNGGGDEQRCNRATSSIFKSVASDKISIKSQCTKSSHAQSSSRHSSRISVSRQDAAAEVAANEATLEVLLEQECCIEELERLEAEAAERQKVLDTKRRQLERLETVKKLKAAKARQRVYDQSECSDKEISSLLHQSVCMKEKEEVKHENNLLQHHSSPQDRAHSKQDDSTAALVRALAESISAGRLPIPEPTIFNGDPLRFNDWKVSFQTLIDRKNIPAEENIYYLRKYVGGPAKKAIESYFLLGSESAYHAAWRILEERYGNPFLIAKAFRDKLEAWPKISSKGSIELQEFADFLRSCEAAMTQIRGLEVLNDCNENQKLLAKLPDWLTSRWNRNVIEVEEESHTFPSFQQCLEKKLKGNEQYCRDYKTFMDETIACGDAELVPEEDISKTPAWTRTRFREETIRFIQKNFYVDDGLASVESENQAIQLVKEARELCRTGKLRLHKFISNSKEVLATIPEEECAKAVKDLTMMLGEPHMERALGVQWCVTSDELQFRVVVKENPLTRRGVLSTVASVYDPLGFVAPFILVGKQILQQMCRDKLSWDDPLPDDLRPL
ncbi:uncharacterized protein LOC123484206 [Coregonus clupeaformis]|uniref:uncharacterized protein LOC123484206 n=1 Tax=Coregonus clupeaformis TaxID=59861 RepID=UPI001E1C34AB|nr:uncharacterized protein LOC123484206 [Coregonus clupeaformis]